MISLETGQKLKAAGLEWRPSQFDLFAIPDRYMDDDRFVISDVQATVERLQGMQVVAFQGASEWALDALVTSEIVWLPSETQLREALEALLLEAGRPELRLYCGLNGCRVDFQWGGEGRSFPAADGAEAYAAGLLFVLRSRRSA
jgi:hypothetical protein